MNVCIELTDDQFEEYIRDWLLRHISYAEINLDSPFLHKDDRKAAKKDLKAMLHLLTYVSVAEDL